MRRRLYIHQRPDWPNFTWDSEALAPSLAAVHHRQGRLLGRMEALGFDLRVEASLTAMTAEVVKSSAIEGEALDPDVVRSSLARKLGLDVAGLPKAGRDVEGIVEMMLDATRRAEARLTKRRLHDWHAALFPTGRSGLVRITVGAWRTPAAGPMQVVSGPIGKQTVHFEAPEAGRLAGEMASFLRWFNGSTTMDPVLKAALAHFWFVTIHPFGDGNGRIARAIGELALARADGSAERFYSMSSQIERERKAYYGALEAAQRGDVDITSWLAWFLGCLDRALEGAGQVVGAVLRKAELWRRINRHPVNERQRAVLNRLMNGFVGHLTTSKYAKFAKCSTDTALRDIQDLVARRILVRNEAGGRSTNYRLGDPERVAD